MHKSKSAPTLQSTDLPRAWPEQLRLAFAAIPAAFQRSFRLPAGICKVLVEMVMFATKGLFILQAFRLKFFYV